MSVIKDLGRVKGEIGDTYIPKITEEDGQLIFSWEKISYTESKEADLENYVFNFPMYVPEMNGTNLSFRLTKPALDTDGTALPSIIPCGNIKGDKGDEGIIRYNIEQISPNIEITDPSITRKNDTLYVQGKKAWIYDENATDPENPFILIEGMDLSAYALSADVYTKNDIDDMFDGVTRQIEKIAQLYDVNTN